MWLAAVSVTDKPISCVAGALNSETSKFKDIKFMPANVNFGDRLGIGSRRRIKAVFSK